MPEPQFDRPVPKDVLEAALAPFAKMLDALVPTDGNLVITNPALERTAELPNYYLTRDDLVLAKAVLDSLRKSHDEPIDEEVPE